MAGAYGDDNYQPQSYQDDLATDDNTPDPAMQDLTDDPTDELGVDPDAFGEELKKYTDEDLQADEMGDDEDELEDRGSLIEDEDDEDGILPANKE